MKGGAMEEKIETGLTRRGFLKTTALVAGAASAAGLSGCQNLAGEELPSTEGEPTPVVEEQVYTHNCRGNCGGGACRLLTTVREGKVVRCTPGEFTGDEGVVQGGCLKGQANPQRIYSTHRLLYPMLQKGERGSDNWERISWDEAFEILAEKWQAAVDEYGNESVGFETYCSNGNYIGGTMFGPYNDCNARYQMGVGFERFVQKTGMSLYFGSADAAASWMWLYAMNFPYNTAEDLVNAKTIIVFGANPAEAVREAWPWFLKAKEAGAKIFCIDPRYSHTAARSDVWVPIRPGTDGALFLAMCNYIIDNDLIDYDYLRNKSVAPFLVKEDGSYLRLSDLGKDPIEVTDAMGNVAPYDCEVVYDEANKTYGASREVVDPAISGTFEVKGIKVRTVYDCAVENIKPFTVAFAAEECGMPEESIVQLAEAYAKDTPSSFVHWYGAERLYNSWRMYLGLAMLAALTGNACKPGANYGMPLARSSIYQTPVNPNKACCVLDDPLPSTMITANRIPLIMENNKWAGRDFHLRLLLVMGANPMESENGIDKLIEAYNKIDFVVVHDQFMTDTAKYASMVLPCTMNFEETDFNGQYFMRKAIEPVGEGKSNFEVFVGLANALGYTDLYDKDAEGYLREMLDTPENKEAGVAYDDYFEQGAIIGELQNEPIVGQETNPTGRTQFYLESMPVRDDVGQVIPFEDRLPNYAHAWEAYPTNPLREKYPFFGVSYHEIYNGQSMHSNVPWINELRGYEGEPYILISEKPAAERGIKTGDMVRTFNDRNYVVTRAIVSKGLHEDVVVVPRGYTADEFVEGNANALTCWESTDEVCSNDTTNDWLCQVEKI